LLGLRLAASAEDSYNVDRSWVFGENVSSMAHVGERGGGSSGWETYGQ